jgi:hypothetical protein
MVVKLVTFVSTNILVAAGFNWEVISMEKQQVTSRASVSLSADGSRVAIGARYNDGNGTDAGHVRIYEYSGGSWIQLGKILMEKQPVTFRVFQYHYRQMAVPLPLEPKITMEMDHILVTYGQMG